MSQSDPDAAKEKPKYFFFVDGKKYDWSMPTITGDQVRASLPGLDPSFRIVVEGHGGEVDRPIEPSDTFYLDPSQGGPTKFYTAPPATFGRR